jgi:putative phosphoesterase
MKRIGLISDTHNFLDDEAFKYFDQCDEIWHAGDFGSIAIADQIASFRPLKGIYGNIDGYDVRSIYPEVNFFTCEEVKVLMIHIGGYPKRYSPLAKKEIKEKQPTLFISGHSHILKIMFDAEFNCLHMNPGAYGKQGWHKIRTLIRFTIDGTDMRDCEVGEFKR